MVREGGGACSWLQASRFREAGHYLTKGIHAACKRREFVYEAAVATSWCISDSHLALRYVGSGVTSRRDFQRTRIAKTFTVLVKITEGVASRQRHLLGFNLPQRYRQGQANSDEVFFVWRLRASVVSPWHWIGSMAIPQPYTELDTGDLNATRERKKWSKRKRGRRPAQARRHLGTPICNLEGINRGAVPHEWLWRNGSSPL